MIDLHIHTTCSDGQFSPEETIRMAHQAGVTVAAVTDHDTVSGIVAASAAAVVCGMTFFPGIEISVQGGKGTAYSGIWRSSRQRCAAPVLCQARR